MLSASLLQPCTPSMLTSRPWRVFVPDPVMLSADLNDDLLAQPGVIKEALDAASLSLEAIDAFA